MFASSPPRLLVLVGPTATGKTEIAVKLCETIGGEIVGADSVQVYRGFNIGSAKPSLESLRGIRHHMLDILEPDQPIDAVGYARLADDVIAQVLARGTIPVVVGGTGLWIRALVRGLVQLPRVNRVLREKLEGEWLTLGPEVMYRRLSQVDARSAARIHPHDRIRVVRALEVYEQCGMPAGELRAEHALGSRRFRTLTINVAIARDELDERLRRRTRAMIDAGWVEEVRRLVEKHGVGIRALHSVGYKQMVAHVVRGVPLETTEQEIWRGTRQYARRQRTWFRSDPDVDATMLPTEVLSPQTLGQIADFLANTGK
jgi:tRNA dimethylallyltransferase